jgi:hypothetical protein
LRRAAVIGGNQRKLENFCGRGKKGVRRILVRKMKFDYGKNDLGGQGRFSQRKFSKRQRDSFLRAHVQFDSAFFNKDAEFPDTDRGKPFFRWPGSPMPSQSGARFL